MDAVELQNMLISFLFMAQVKGVCTADLDSVPNV